MSRDSTLLRLFLPEWAALDTLTLSFANLPKEPPELLPGGSCLCGEQARVKGPRPLQGAKGDSVPCPNDITRVVVRCWGPGACPLVSRAADIMEQRYKAKPPGSVAEWSRGGGCSEGVARGAGAEGESREAERSERGG